MILALSGLGSQDRALALVVDPDRDHRGDRGDPAGLTDLVERRIQPHVGVLTVDRTGQEGPHLLVEDLADARDLAPGDPIDPERLHQIIDLAGGHPLHVGLHHDGVKRLLGTSARFQQRREVGAGRDLRDLELDRADPGVPGPGAIAVAIGNSFGAPFVGAAPI
jgi:hypothetical protein